MAVGLRLNSLALGLSVDLVARSGVDCWVGLEDDETGVVGDVRGWAELGGVVSVEIICPGEGRGVVLGAGVMLVGWGDVAVEPVSG